MKKSIIKTKWKNFLLLGGILFFAGTKIHPAEETLPSAASVELPSLTEFLLDETPPLRPLRTVNRLNPDSPAARNAIPPSAYFPPVPAAVPNRTSGSLMDTDSLEKSLTQYYIKQYSSPGGLAWLEAIMKRGAPYLNFIRHEIEERNLPPELLYLPVIESQFSATALSRSGASGLWQFMKNSIAPFDMKVTDWIDERRDFWKSTQGALRKLEENYIYFKDWPLALAAYNAGLGAVRGTIRSSGIDDYWLLCERRLLKTETIHYVPKLLAAAHILSNPRRYGLSILWAEDPHWTRIAVNRSADLTILAREADVDAALLQQANRELLYNVTPPERGYYLKVPERDAEKISAVLARTDLSLVRYYIHTIRSGDTLSALALHYGITVEHILESNPGTQARYLRIGARIMIPAFKDAGPFVNNRNRGENLVFSGTHVVAKGETLWSIALAFDVDPESLAEANGMLLNDILREGRTLKTPIRE